MTPTPFRRFFLAWFLLLLLFFFLANLMGLIRPQGLLPITTTGFPFFIADWGIDGDEIHIYWDFLCYNLLVALFVSSLLAFLLAHLRTKNQNTAGRPRPT